MTANNTRWHIPALATILYFSQGLPFGVVNETINLYLASQKVSLVQIGLFSSVGYAWTLKFLWAPLVDATGTYRRWMLGALAIIAGSIALLGVSAPASSVFWMAAIALAFASATQDIAIDATAIRMTPPDLLGIVNSIRVAAYRVAMIAAGSGVALLAVPLGWSNAFLAAALVPILVGIVVVLTVPARSGEGQRHENPLRALLGWFRRPGAVTLLLVILLYRLGDAALNPMIRPFWLSHGFSAAEVANVTTTLYLLVLIFGAFVGGALIVKIGIFQGLLWFGITQLLSNVVYALIAATGASRTMLYVGSAVEGFTWGLGTAAFLSFLMFICDKSNAATEYAALTAVFALSRTLAMSVSGYFAEGMGFTNYFWLTAALALPGLLLLPFIRERVRGPLETVITED